VTQRFDHLIEVQCILTVEKLRHKRIDRFRARLEHLRRRRGRRHVCAIDALADKLQRACAAQGTRTRSPRARRQKHRLAVAL